ncbi:MAG TPA: alpha/beta fold hydrolase [Dehalococcoidia bacterium]|nr:alpha/beta fold hydrolase [Dehalococcoidia bacterium]
MTTYVLVHGAWAGAWVWHDVRPLIWRAGFEVYTPSLSGQSERIHIGGPHINLTTHIEDVKKLIEFEDLSDVVLVGHSYGGMVITGLADLIPQRLKHVVFLDAFMPKDGESVMDIASGFEYTVEDGWRLVRLPATPAANATPSPIQRIFGHPVGTMQERVHLSVPLEQRDFALTYIKATQPPRGEPGSQEAFWTALERAEASPRWQTVGMDTTHNIQITMPNELGEILLKMG